MAKMVGLSRKITLSWLNMAANLSNERLEENEYKSRVNEYLSYEIESPTNIRKTREILMNIWYYEEDPTIVNLRKEALNLFNRYPEYAVAIHWCMLLAVYPVFVDLSKLMGRLFEYNDVIVLKQLKQKLFDEWGERTTLYHSVDKIISTIKEIGVINTIKVGNYVINKQKINNRAIVSFIIRTAMTVTDESYYSIADLKEFEILFPFEYDVDNELLMENENFSVVTFGNETSITLKSHQ